MEASKEERVDLLNRLRQWIDEQESLEAEGTHDPPPLTEKQRSAILALVPGKNTTSKSDDYGTGNRNWVSEVNTYFQKRQLPSPFYTDESISVPHSNIQWRTWCVFHDGTRLPRVGLGAREGDQPPTFSNKKDSKQYAAQKAYEYLEMIQGNMPTSKPRRSSGAAKTASTHNGLLSTPPAKRPKVKDMSSEPEAVRSSSTMASPTGDASSIFDALNRASVSLGIPGPDIETEPDADVGEGFFKGRAVFVPWAKVPEGLGNKSGILSKNECRVQIAQAVLGWMQQEMKQRQELAEALINNINNKTKKLPVSF